MRLWPRMSGALIAKLASSFSLLAAFCAAGAESYRELSQAISAAQSVAEFRQLSEPYKSLIGRDPGLSEAFRTTWSASSVEDFKGMVAIRAAAETPIAARDHAAEARQIKSNPLYRDPGVAEQSNWLDGAMRRLADLMPKRGQNPNISLPQSGIPGWIVPGMWFLLGLAVATFGYFAIRHFTWKRGLKRKVKAVLEDDEPERTLDEWLLLADEHAAAGRYREAVRAMYLSCLLKFDEAGVARFVRGETNWEHLRRITASHVKPATIDFLAPTQTFDRIWYGMRTKGREDVDLFRLWYQKITDALKAVRK